MAVFNLATLLAIIAIRSVNASPEEGCPVPPSTTFATSIIASATASESTSAPGPTLGSTSEPVCIYRESPGQSMICGSLGSTANRDGAAEFPIKTKSVLLCADLCNETEGCKTFSYDNGQCQMYYNAMDNLGFRAVKDMQDKRHPLLWYERNCFLCENTNRLVMGDDFESDNSIDSWATISDNLDDFLIDIQTTTLRNGRKTKVLRIAEAGTTTAAEIQRFPKFTLQEGASYQVTFYGKADARGQEWASDDFHPITPVVWNADKTVLEWFPEREGGGLPMGDGWYRFRTRFEVGGGFGGEYVFSFVVNSSGKELDWYFDDVTVVSV